MSTVIFPCFYPIPMGIFHPPTPPIFAPRLVSYDMMAPHPSAMISPQRLPLFELHTLPVPTSCVPDGDGVNVCVDTVDDHDSVPEDVYITALQLIRARTRRDCDRANELHKKISEAGYQVIKSRNGSILAQKYRVRLMGIDAPETAMAYGKEAKEELIKLVSNKSLRVLVYDRDRYGRYVADVYCGDIFVQEELLKKGLAWHYTAYDDRPEFAMWEKQARAKRIGLWSSPNPEKPWDWRRDRRQEIALR